MTRFARTSLFGLLAIGSAWTLRAAEPVEAPAPTVNPQLAAAASACQLPYTKSYQIKPTFCPAKLVALIPQAVGDDGEGCCCGDDCGPYGIPPIYAVGSYVMVRQTPAVQARVAEFLTDLGALVPSRKASTYDPKSL